MKRSAFLKLLACYLLYGIIGFVVLMTFTQFLLKQMTLANESSRLYREATTIASDYASDYYSLTPANRSSIEEVLAQTESYLGVSVQITDTGGTVYYPSASSGSEDYERIEGFDIGDFGADHSQIGRFYGTLAEKSLTVFYPVTADYRVQGYVLIHKPISSIYSSADGFLNIAFYTVALIFGIGFLFILAFGLLIFRPLRKILEGSREFAKGNFEKRIRISPGSDLSELADSVNFMAGTLETLEESQREFISSVSHDFRSPLTSIRGYVDAMRDGIIPAEMQDHYFEIIQFQVERLTRLTESLLELNSFHGRGIPISRQNFEINDMIRATLNSFEGRCRGRGISFDLILTGNELTVNGDPDKIERVLYNLIDNAIKFSSDNSSITVSTRVSNGKLFLSVKDSGIGIPSDSIGRIWDRFYKTDLSRGKDKTGSGLGLSIVKEIITAHGEQINVVSTQGAGTTFTFSLPLAEE